jgi:hypothetical protein
MGAEKICVNAIDQQIECLVENNLVDVDFSTGTYGQKTKR